MVDGGAPGSGTAGYDARHRANAPSSGTPHEPSAPVAGSASFSEALDAYARAVSASRWDSPADEAANRVAAYRARVESLHRDEVERLTKERDAFVATYRAVHDVLLGKEPGADPTAAAVARRIASLLTARHERAEAAEAREAEAREALAECVSLMEAVEWHEGTWCVWRCRGWPRKHGFERNEALDQPCRYGAALARARAVLGARPGAKEDP